MSIHALFVLTIDCRHLAHSDAEEPLQIIYYENLKIVDFSQLNIFSLNLHQKFFFIIPEILYMITLWQNQSEKFDGRINVTTRWTICIID